MEHLHLNKKTLLIIGGGIALVLLYYWYQNRSASSAANAATASDPTGATSDPASSDYADLAGQIQQGGAQETSDVGSLASQLNAQAGQESSDVAGLNAQISGLETDISNIPAGPPGTAGATGPQGAQGVNAPGFVNTHSGGAFYKFYTAVTGHAPPAQISTGNVIYAAWKHGATSNQVKRLLNPPHTAATNARRTTSASAVSRRSHGVQRAGQAVSRVNHPATAGAVHPNSGSTSSSGNRVAPSSKHKEDKKKKKK